MGVFGQAVGMKVNESKSCVVMLGNQHCGNIGPGESNVVTQLKICGSYHMSCVPDARVINSRLVY